MKKFNIKKAIAVYGVVGGIVCLNTSIANATENETNLLNSNIPQENVDSRLALKGQVVNVDGTYLRIRSNPSTSSEILGTLSEGMKFDILSLSGNWYKINYNGTTGYVHGDYVQEIKGTSNEDTLYYGKVYDAEPNLRVRTTASLNATIIGYIPNNTTVSIVGVENDWYKIKYDSGYGYVHSDYILVESNGSENINKIGFAYNLNSSSLNIRETATTSAKIIGTISEGQKVNIIGSTENWYKISYNNGIGYVSKDYIKLEDSTSDSNNPGNSENLKGKVVNVGSSNLRVRQAANTDSFVIGYLLENSIVNIIQKEGSWYKIQFNNSIGYVSGDYIEIISNSDSSSNQAYDLILSSMKNQIGSPYVWGGAGESLTTSFLNELKQRFPYETSQGEYSHAEQFVDMGYLSFDCSGLMQWGFAQAGIYIGRTTYDQINNGTAVSLDNLMVGDLLFTSDLGHVGMYIGNNQWIESPDAGLAVRIVDVPWSYIKYARRVIQ